MTIFEDPKTVLMLSLCLIAVLIALCSGRRQEVWLVLLMVTLFALPRAGIFIEAIRLPLPLAHVLAAVFITIWLLRPHRLERRSNIHYYFMAYAAAACWGLGLGLATGGNILIAFLEISFYLLAIGLFFYASETFREKRYFRTFMSAILVISALVSLYGIAQQFLGAGILVDRLTYNSATDQARSFVVYAGHARRVLSSYGDPNVLSSQLIVFVGMALAVVVGRRVRPETRLAWFVVLVLNLTCLCFARSRAALICLFVVATVVCVWRTRWALLALPLLCIAAYFTWDTMGGGGITSAAMAKMGGIVPEQDLRRRFAGWAWDFARGVPLGCGFGNSVELQMDLAMWRFAVVPAKHVWMGFNSFWLSMFSRIGVPGVLTFALLLATLFRSVWRQARLVTDGEVQAVIIGGLAGFLGQWIIWMVNNAYMLPGGGVNFWFMMGMLYAGSRAFAVQRAVVLVPAGEMLSPYQLAVT